MAVGSLSERLAFVLSLDADGAIRGFKKVGDTAEKELGRADNRLDKVGGTMQKVGVGAIAFAGVAGLGLFKMAQMSEEAKKSTVRLQNSIANNPNLAGQSTKAYEDLATAIMRKTAADDDDIVSGEAVLAQFRLNKEQITELTPLVVDYARKMGVDMNTAAKAVAKSIDGTNTTLKRSGIQFDETSFAADHYKGTVDALKNSVGGFAEQEGQTFAGRLERLQNELSNLAEGVGVGVVKAFEHFADAADTVLGKLDELSPGTESAIGEFATYGTVVLGAAGAASFLIGSLVKMHTNFGIASGKIKNVISNLGGMKSALTGVGVAAGTIGAIVVGANLLNDAFGAGGDSAQKWEQKIIDASSKTTDQLVADWREMGSHIGWGAEQQRMFFQGLTESGPQSIATAKRLADALAAQGEDTSKLRAQIDSATEGQRQLNADQKAGTEIVGEEASATEEATSAIEAHTKALEDDRKSLEAKHEATISAINSDIGYQEAQHSTAEALAELTAKQDEANRATGEDAPAAQAALQDASDSTLNAIRSQAAAAVQLRTDQAAANGTTLDAADKSRTFAEELYKLALQLAPDSPLRSQLIAWINDLNSVPRTITTDILQEFHTVGGGPTRQMASGGSFHSGEVALVGEDGPELVKFNGSGQVVPNSQVNALPPPAITTMPNQPIEEHIHITLDGREIAEAIRRYDRSLK